MRTFNTILCDIVLDWAPGHGEGEHGEGGQDAAEGGGGRRHSPVVGGGRPQVAGGRRLGEGVAQGGGNRRGGEHRQATEAQGGLGFHDFDPSQILSKRALLDNAFGLFELVLLSSNITVPLC